MKAMGVKPVTAGQAAQKSSAVFKLFVGSVTAGQAAQKDLYATAARAVAVTAGQAAQKRSTEHDHQEIHRHCRTGSSEM